MTALSSSFNRQRRVILAGLLGLLLAILLNLWLGERLVRPLHDLWQQTAPRDVSGSKVAVVLIDAESIAEVGPWPWPRYHMARLTEEIAGRGAVAIGFDIIFSEVDRVKPERFAALYPELSASAAAEVNALEPMDLRFGQILGRTPAVLGRIAVLDGGTDPEPLPVEAQIDVTPGERLLAFPQAIANIPELEYAALGHGLMNGPPDADGKVRRVPMLVKTGDRAMPSLSLELARVAMGAEAVDLTNNILTLGQQRVPLDGAGRMRLRFGTFPEADTYGAVDLLRSGIPADEFAGKVVLIGLGAEGTADIVSTPMAAESYGVFTQAQAVDALARGGWLNRPSWAGWAEWAAGLLLAALVLAFLPRRRSGWLALPIALAIAIPVGAWLAFDRSSLLFDPLIPLILGAGAALGVGSGLFGDARRERERLRETLVTERIAAAATQGELQAARDIQMGMLPTRASLAALDPRIDADAMLEAAKSVGGDFYDAIRIDPDRIVFVIGDVTGKGVPAALFMALSKALTKSVVLRDPPDLAEAAIILNAELSRDNDDSMGVTMLLCLLDMRNGAVAMVNAGHENPLLIGTDGAVSEIRMEGGPPFCVVDYPYPVETRVLAPGEALVFLTDGVTEAQNGAEELLGAEAAQEIVAAHGAAGAAEIIGCLHSAVRAFEDGTEPSDDVTILVVRYLGG